MVAATAQIVETSQSDYVSESSGCLDCSVLSGLTFADFAVSATVTVGDSLESRAAAKY